MLRILNILPSNHSVPPSADCGGISWLLHGISNNIDQNKFQITLLSIKKGESNINDADICYSYHNVPTGFFYKALVRFLKIIPYSVKQRIFFSGSEKKIARCLLLAFYARFICQSDLIITHVYPTLPRALFLFGLNNTKIIYYFHGSGYCNAYSPKVTSFLNDYCKGLITIAKEEIPESLFKGPIKHILNAIDLDEIEAMQANKSRSDKITNSIIFAGLLVSNKGVKELILAVQRLVDKDSSVKLFIAGSIPDNSYKTLKYLDEIKSLASYYPDNIFFLGKVQHKKLISLYPKFQIGALLSQEREGNSLFLMECISNELPVIASRIGGIPQIVDENITGLLVTEPKNIDEITKKLSRLLYEEDFYQQLKANTRAVSKNKFSFQRAAHELEEFLSTFN
mgnify:CR=1 FL=1